MKIALELATDEHKELYTNLMEKYFYEFAQWTTITMDEKGLYGCDKMVDMYYKNENYLPYIIRVDDKIAGLAVVLCVDSENIDVHFRIDEFFIIYDYRNKGVGQFIVNSILDKHKGKWDLEYATSNLASVKFWLKVIGEYTGGKYKMFENCSHRPNCDSTLATVLEFESNS